MNTYQMMNPEAFTEEYEEEQQVLAELAQPVEYEEYDLCDIVREHEEDEGEPLNLDPTRDYAGEWDEFWSRFDFPFEGGE
jgi:hypothetical protein